MKIIKIEVRRHHSEVYFNGEVDTPFATFPFSGRFEGGTLFAAIGDYRRVEVTPFEGVSVFLDGEYGGGNLIDFMGSDLMRRFGLALWVEIANPL